MTTGKTEKTGKTETTETTGKTEIIATTTTKIEITTENNRWLEKQVAAVSVATYIYLFSLV